MDEKVGTCEITDTTSVTATFNEDKNEVTKRVRRHRRSKWRRPRWKTNSKVFNNQGLPDSYHNHHHFNQRKTCWQNVRVPGDQPLAPYNTNQFLMDDHDVRMPDIEQSDRLLQHSNNDNNDNNNNNNNNSSDKESSSERCAGAQNSNVTGHRRRCNSDCTPNRQESQECSSDEINSLPDDEYDFMQQQFSETYEKIHTERISSMSKSQLVEEYLILERRCEQLEDKVKEMENELNQVRGLKENGQT